MFWDNINTELIKKVKRYDLSVLKLKDGYSYRLNKDIKSGGFKTRKEAIIHADETFKKLNQ